MFSLVPRCHGLCGSQKQIGRQVWFPSCACWAISVPWSQVSDRRSCAAQLLSEVGDCRARYLTGDALASRRRPGQTTALDPSQARPKTDQPIRGEARNPNHRKALRKAIRRVFGNDVPVQRCTQHKQRNVLDHLPERDRPAVKTRLRRAWKETDHPSALELDHTHPGAPASLRQGLEETLTVTRLGITGKLKVTLQSTNPCESMISTVRVIHRNVKHWSSGDMCLRWTAAGMLEAETRQGRGLPRPRHPRRQDRTGPPP